MFFIDYICRSVEHNFSCRLAIYYFYYHGSLYTVLCDVSKGSKTLKHLNTKLCSIVYEMLWYYTELINDVLLILSGSLWTYYRHR